MVIAAVSVLAPLPVREIARAVLLTLAILDLWIIVDTKRALGILRKRTTPFWIWFYRIDLGAVLIAGIYMYATGQFLR